MATEAHAAAAAVAQSQVLRQGLMAVLGGEVLAVEQLLVLPLLPVRVLVVQVLSYWSGDHGNLQINQWQPHHC